MLAALQWVDLGAFVALALAGVLIGAHVVGLVLWLRRQAEGSETRDSFHGL